MSRRYYISETFPGTTVKQTFMFDIENIANDITNDTLMYNLIISYDIIMMQFVPKRKPFWQYPPLPEYV